MFEPTTSDRELIDAVLGGDRDAFRGLVERESESVVATCRRILRDPVEAEDAAQDAFIQAYRSLATFRGDGPFGAWLRRIAIRVAIASAVARQKAPVFNGPAVEYDAVEAGTYVDPEARAIFGEDLADMTDAIKRLPGAQREVILLRFYGDLSLEEIAGLTNHPIGTVKSRLSRGAAALRQQRSPEPPV